MAAVLAVAASVVLGPVLLAGPASANGTLPDEPPGGATCAPGAPATDCQQEPAEPAPSATPTTAANPTTLPTTGGSKPVSRPTLAHTGSVDLGYGVTGGVLLALGSGLVLAGRRTARA